KLIEPLTRKQTSILTQLRTGHAPLQSHLHSIGKAEHPNCLLCATGREDVRHYIMRCPKFHEARRRLRRRIGRAADHLEELLTNGAHMDNLFQFINETKRFRTTYGR
ncbi:hypothetical protein OF83DRAFT_1033724, partial [Amylostereum chailletii]